MTGGEPVSVARLFAGLIPDEVASAYDRLLHEDGGVTEEEAAEFVGGEDIKQALTDLNMVATATPSSVAAFTPVSLELALHGVLADLHARARHDEQLLAEGIRRADDVRSQRPAGTRLPDDSVELITDRVRITEVSSALINRARTEWLTLENNHRDTPLREEHVVTGPKATRDHVTRRAIYERPFYDDPVGRRIIESCAEAGEQARIRPRVRMKMQIADSDAVLIGLTLTGMGGALLIYAPPVVAAMREYFELLWPRASPVNGPEQDPGIPLSPRRQKILSLAATGYTNHKIASELGLAVSTVHKNIEAIVQQLEATTRLEAGVTAHRLNWVS
jgi:DNA-binding CsgD family transcriptional regulator